MADVINFDLVKKAETLTFVLEKKGITKAPTMRVCAALDISQSMEDEINDGSLQKAVDQLGGVGIKFDDNGEIDMWKFDDRSDYIGVWTPEDYGNYVRKNSIRARGGTSYSPFINHICDHMFQKGTEKVAVQREKRGFLGFGKKTVTEYIDSPTNEPANNDPVLVMVITDGEPYGDDRSLIDQALRRSQTLPSFFTFVGVSNQGNGAFPTLSYLEKTHDNVGFVKLSGFNLSDEDVYKALVTDKLVNFLKKFPA